MTATVKTMTKDEATQYFNSLGRILNLIQQMQSCGNKDTASYAVTLLGPRKRGSTTEYGLDKIKPDREVYPIEGDKAECVYLGMEAPELKGTLGAITVEECLEQGKLVKIRNGAHGPELYLDVPPERADHPPAPHVTFILGPSKETECGWSLWTWHPGDPMPAFDGTTIQWNHAVKTHNGK